MNPLRKILAFLEVVVMTFAAVPFLTLGIYRLFPRLEAWQTERVGFPFPVLVYLVMMAVPLLDAVVRRRPAADYGIAFGKPRYHLDIAATCFVPVAAANFPLGMGLDYRSWGGALVLAVIQIGLLFLLGWLLRKKSSPSDTRAVLGLSAGMLAMPSLVQAGDATVGKAVVLFLTYAFFVGFGEEMFYRGYVQGRLNEVFGRPYRFFDVPFGWGAMLTAFLFGLTHVGILRWILGLNTSVTLAWGFWTIFSGLVFGFVREKSGSIVAPALLHGLPQAIATVAMLFL